MLVYVKKKKEVIGCYCFCPNFGIVGQCMCSQFRLFFDKVSFIKHSGVNYVGKCMKALYISEC